MQHDVEALAFLVLERCANLDLKAFGVLAACLLGADHAAPGRPQRLPLQGVILVKRGDACVAAESRPSEERGGWSVPRSYPWSSGMQGIMPFS